MRIPLFLTLSYSRSLIRCEVLYPDRKFQAGIYDSSFCTSTLLLAI